MANAEIYWTDFHLHNDPLPLTVRTVGRHEEVYFVLPTGFPEHQLLLSVAGCGELIMQDAIYPLPKNSLFFFPPHTPLHYRATGAEPWVTAWVTFTAQEPFSLFFKEKPGLYRVANDELFKSIESILNLPKPGRRHEASILLYRLLLNLPSYLSPYNISPEKHIKSGPDLALQYIHTHYTEKITVNELAEIANMPRIAFSRLFQKQYGRSPSEYMEYNRYHMICEYIKRAGNTPFDEIARIFGFSNPSRFYALFKKKGSTPEAERIHLQNLATRRPWE